MNSQEELLEFFSLKCWPLKFHVDDEGWYQVTLETPAGEVEGLADNACDALLMAYDEILETGL